MKGSTLRYKEAGAKLTPFAEETFLPLADLCENVMIVKNINLSNYDAERMQRLCKDFLSKLNDMGSYTNEDLMLISIQTKT